MGTVILDRVVPILSFLEIIMPATPLEVSVCGYVNAGLCLAGCKSGNGGVCKREEIDYRQYGYLAVKYCHKVLPLAVLDAGYRSYCIGTSDPEDGPFSRESREYWDSFEDAETALANGIWTQRPEP